MILQYDHTNVRNIGIMKNITTVLLMLFAFCMSALAEIRTGKAGDNVTYEFDTTTGELRLFGTGETYNRGGEWNYGFTGSSPIADYRTTSWWWSGIKSVVIEEGVTSIGAAFFYRCTELTSVQMASSVSVIGNEAFRGCSSLQSITIGAGVTDVKDRSFTDCSSMTYISVDEANTSYISIGGVLYTSDFTKIVRFPEALNTYDYVIPEGVTGAATDALYHLTYVESITIPTSMTVIDYGSFDQTPKLNTLVFKSTTPPNFIKKDLAGVNVTTVYVPCGAEAAYKASDWKGFQIKGALTEGVVVDFRVYTNDPELGDVKVRSRADCVSRTFTIEAIPTTFGRFVQWQDGNTSNPRQVVVPETSSETFAYTAYFVANDESITVKKGTENLNKTDVRGYYQVSATDNGTPEKKIETTGVNTSASTNYKYGDVITLYCNVTQTGYKFRRWSDGNKENPRVVTVTSSNTYSAEIEKGQVTIKTSTLNTSYGTTSPGSTTVEFGTEVTITATPKANYDFLRWDDGDTNPTRKVIATANKTYTAYFQTKKYTVSVSVNDDAMGSVTGYGTFSAGTDVSLNAIANPGYEFASWSGGITSTSNPASISNLSRDYNINATFRPIKYTIVFLKADGGVLSSSPVDYNTMPTIPADPTKASTAKYSYSFAGWDPAVDLVQGDQTYTPIFDESIRTYTVKFVNDNGSVLQSTVQEYGSAAQYNGATPTKAADAQYTYDFLGWNTTPGTVTGDVTYTARYNRTLNSYDITFVDYDGAVLKATQKINYGVTPTPPANPTRAGDVQYTYTFKGWSPAVAAVTGKQVYTATYTSTLKNYTVTFKDGNGKTLATETYSYGSTPSYKGAETPTKAATAEFSYTFNNTWEPAITKVTGNAVYTAKFTATTNKYWITFKNWDGSQLQRTQVSYGATPVYSGATPTKPASAEIKYKFNGWNTTIAPVTGDATYTAQFVDGDAVLYEVKFVDEDGTVLLAKSYKYGEKPVYSPDPTKASTTQSVFTFSGWSPAVQIVTDKSVKTFTATYSASPRPYTITFYDEDGVTVRQQSTFTYGSTPVYSGAALTKKATDEYTYTFSGWSPKIGTVTGDAQYSAVYSAKKNKYTVTFEDYDGTPLKVQDVEYGSSATPPTSPTREGYTFRGWQGSYTSVKKAVTVTATYDINKYTIQFKNYDGSLLDEQVCEYGVKPSYAGTPVRPETAQYTYTFKGWDKDIVAAKANTIYTATYSSKVKSYTIEFWNEGGKAPMLSVDVPYGSTPNYTGSTPQKAADAQYTYTFSGWDPAITTVTGKAKYTAVYSKKVNEYLVNFVNWNGSALTDGVQSVEYGKVPVYTATPVRPQTDQYEYAFIGWNPSVKAVSGPSTYTAQYSETVRSYEINFVNYDGTVLESVNFLYGQTPSYSGETPTRPSDALNNYTFTGWSPEIGTVKGAKTYTAQYSTASIIYTIRFEDYDGTELLTKYVPAGSVITCDLVPTREQNDNFSYAFNGWSPALTSSLKATGDMTFTAQYDATWREYNVRFEKDDHTEIVTKKVRYNELPIAPPDPTKAQTDKYTYVFAGWNNPITEVLGNQTYTAVFTPVIRKYTVKFLDYDGSTLQSKEYDYGTTPSCVQPTRESDAHYTYSFKSWKPAVTEVVGNATYTAEYNLTVNTYTVTFKNDDGTVIDSDVYEYGAQPRCDKTPEKSATKEYTYTFAGWDKTVVAVTGNAVYTATYSAKKNVYTVVFADESGNAIKTYQLEYGSTPVFDGVEPVKDATAEFTYTFSGWTPTVAMVTDNVTYKPVFSSKVNSYTVVFKNYDGTVLQTESLEYGSTPVYKADDPVKAGDAQFSYVFTGWDKAVSDVVGNATYIAQYSEKVNSYEIRFVNYDNTLLQSVMVEYGKTPEYSGSTPQREGDKLVNYTFKSWSPAITNVTGNATYTATYTTAENVYIITFVDYDGHILLSNGVESGEVITCDIIPTREAVDKVYTFSGWDPVLTDGMKPTEDMIFTAQYTDVPRKYNVTFVMDDGVTVIESNAVEYNTLPTEPTSVTKDKTAQYSYTFSGWDKTIEKVVSDVVYTAVFSSEVRSYTVSFLDYDGSVLLSKSYLYGDTPSCANPTRDADAQYTYTFTGWDSQVVTVVGDATYTAQYSSVVNKYNVTFKHEDGTVLQSAEYEYGVKPEFLGDDPTKPSTPEFSYSFDGWDAEVIKVSADAVYTATFSATRRSYTIIFADENDVPIKTYTVEYGQLPVYDGDEPVKIPTAQYTYSFEGWIPDIETVTGDATYNTVFSSVVNKYTVTFKNFDGSVIEEAQWNYGATPECRSIPERDGGAQYIYNFAGWDREITEVTADVTYTAVFSSEVKKYKVSFLNYDDAILDQGYFEYGAVPAYNGETPTRPSDGLLNYTFMGWSPDMVTVEEEATYRAVYSTADVIYTMTFVDYDDTELMTVKFEAGATIVCNIVPTRKSTAEKVYEFTGWSPELTEGMTATADMTFKAQYSESGRSYTIRFIMDNGDEISSSEVEYGATPVAPTDVVKASDSQYSYVLSGWSPALAPVTADATYQAVFSAQALTYTVQFVDFDGSVIKSGSYLYGEMPSCEAPSRAADVQYTYAFAGWDKQVVSVSGDAVYTATYLSTLNSYTVTVNCNNVELGSVYGGGTYEYGSKVTISAKPEENCYFVSWNDGDKNAERVIEVVGNVTYSATFSAEDVEDPDDPEIILKPDPSAPCYQIAPAIALYDWLLMVDNKTMRVSGYNVKESDVAWYRIVNEQDNVCDDNTPDDDVIVGEGFYFTSDRNLIGTGQYYAVVNVDGVLFRTRVFDYSTSNKALILPTRANPGQTLTVKGIDGEADIEVYDINGRLVRRVKTDGSCTYEIPAEGTAGVYIVRIVDANGSVLKYVVK